MKIIEFIKQNPNWRELLSQAPYSIEIKEDGNYILFKYNQIESKFSNPDIYPLLKECRGLILHKSDYHIVSHRFDKFWNIQEQLADKIDWSTAKVQEKIDGSLISLQWDGSWFLSTNGTIFAEKAKCGIYEDNFGDLFKQTFKIKYDIDIYEYAENKLNKNYTYIFEFTHPLSRVVVVYEPNIYHTGTRDNISGQELSIDIGIPKPKEYKFNSIEDVIEITKSLPWSFEGYVIVDSNYNRVKVKGASYLAMAHLKGENGLSYRHILEVVSKGEKNEVLAVFPEYTKYFDFVETAYNKYIENVERDLQTV